MRCIEWSGHVEDPRATFTTTAPPNGWIVLRDPQGQLKPGVFSIPSFSSSHGGWSGVEWSGVRSFPYLSTVCTTRTRRYTLPHPLPPNWRIPIPSLTLPLTP